MHPQTSSSVPRETAPGEAEVLGSLAAWERTVFLGLIKSLEWAAGDLEVTRSRVRRSGFVSVALLLLQLTVGHTLARDATVRAATTTASPAATTTTAPGASTTTPGAAGTAPASPDLKACETVMDERLVGVADGQSTRQVVESFATRAKATMNNPKVAVSDFQAAAVQYAAWTKSFGPAAALVAIESYVATGCPSLVSEGFTPRS